MQFTKTAVAGAALGLFIATFGADIVSAQSFISPAPVQSGQCLNMTHNLVRGANDYYSRGEVTALQQFLVSQGLLSNYQVVGNFGPATYRAVVQFQSTNSIYPVTGGVGPLTRAAIQRLSCAGVIPHSGVNIQSVTPNPATVGSTVTVNGSGFTQDSIVYIGVGAVQSGVAVNYNGTQLTFTVPSYVGPYCTRGEPCAMYASQLLDGTYDMHVQNTNGTSNTVSFTVGTTNTNTAPVINSITAPTQIAVGTQGTWTVNATTPWYNPNNQYFVAPVRYSVVWGDETTTQPYGYSMSNQATVQSTGSFTHVYSTPGTYKPVFTVTLDNGQSASASASVVVLQNGSVGNVGQPVVYSMSPQTAAPGTVVTLTGTNFDANTNYITWGTAGTRHRPDGTPDNVIATVGSQNGTTLTFTQAAYCATTQPTSVWA
jgi:hypothetical protein